MCLKNFVAVIYLRYELFQSAPRINLTFKHYESSDEHVVLMNSEELQLQFANVFLE